MCQECEDQFILGKHVDIITLVSRIAHFTVTGANEAGVGLVLLRPFLLYYVNHVVVMLTIIFSAKFP